MGNQQLNNIKNKIIDQILYFLQGYHNKGKNCKKCDNCKENITCIKNQDDMLHTIVTGPLFHRIQQYYSYEHLCFRLCVLYKFFSSNQCIKIRVSLSLGELIAFLCDCKSMTNLFIVLILDLG